DHGLRNSRPPGRPKTALTLSPEERATLTEWAKGTPDTPSPNGDGGQLALRSRIILACATGAPNTRVAEHLGVSRPTVGKWASGAAGSSSAGSTDWPTNPVRGVPRR
ncbi:MAG: helix-turn-helix domain-containing protein, partial [Corynebacterium sp.]